MQRKWKWRSSWLVVLSAFVLAFVSFAALVWNPANQTLNSAVVLAGDLELPTRVSDDDLDAESKARLKDNQQNSGRVQVASLKSTSETLSQMVLAAGPQEVSRDAGSLLYEAEVLREASTPADAIRAYILILDKFPDSPQAKVADDRIAYLLGGRTEAELDAIEAALPPVEDLTDVDGITAIGQFYFKRAQDAGEANPEQAGKYLQLIYDIAWDVFTDDLDDDYKSTLLMGYLFAADALGKGTETRAALSAHADKIPPSFTSWIIKKDVDGEELPFEFMTTDKGRESLRKYYFEKAEEQPNPAAVAAYYMNARDASLSMLFNQPRNVPVLDHTRYYLEAADALGPQAHAEAVAQVEKWIANEPPSIMRWVTRYELAMFLVRFAANGVEAHAGFRHFETMVDEAEAGVVEAAINDSNIDENVRGLLVCMWGHAFAGTNRIRDAENCYNWVLTFFTNETHAGSSAAYSLALMEQRKHSDDAAVGIAALEEFVREHPGSTYSAEALMAVADAQLRSKDEALATETLARIEREYWDTSMAAKAETRREDLARQETEAE
jgi:hypothetical protein